MHKNIEIKARVEDRAALCAALDALCAQPAELLCQDDSFFNAPDGRLKLRRFADGSAELLFYRRADVNGPKTSSYWRAPVSDAAALATLLDNALGSAGRVIKQRWLYRHGRTRIHVDEVLGLGHFMELEVVLAALDSVADGEAEAHDLMQRLQITPQQLVAGAYLDLLNADKDSAT